MLIIQLTLIVKFLIKLLDVNYTINFSYKFFYYKKIKNCSQGDSNSQSLAHKTNALTD